jgi:hypothetical protein
MMFTKASLVLMACLVGIAHAFGPGYQQPAPMYAAGNSGKGGGGGGGGYAQPAPVYAADNSGKGGGYGYAQQPMYTQPGELNKG